MLEVNSVATYCLHVHSTSIGCCAVFVLTENQKIAIDQLVGEAIHVHRACFLEYH